MSIPWGELRWYKSVFLSRRYLFYSLLIHSTSRYCQGETPHGLDFETFYGDDWNKSVEKKFRDWSVRVFGGMSNLFRNVCARLIYSVTERATERRSMFLFGDAGARPGASESGSQTTSDASSSKSQTTPEVSSAKSQETPTAASSKDVPTEAQKSASQPSNSREFVPHSPSTSPLSVHVPTPQVTTTSGSLQSRPTPTPVIPASQTLIDPLPFADPPSGEDLLLVATAIGVHQILSQTEIVPPVVQPPPLATLDSLDIQPSQLFVNPSQLIIEPQVVAGSPQSASTAIGVHQLSSQVAAVPLVVQPPPAAASEIIDIRPSEPSISPSQLVVEPQVIVGPLQSAPGRSHTPAEVLVDTQPNPTPAIHSTSSQPPVGVSTASSIPTPKSQYRVRDPAVTPSEKPRRNSINGAPEMITNLIDGEGEMTVDISDYISIEGDDDESHVSSSQRTADECQELPPPPPNSQQVQVAVGSHSTRTLPQLNIDVGDLPTWMVKKGQWMYLASTAGGAAWEALLKVYMSQERRLEFTEMVSNLGRLFPTF